MRLPLRVAGEQACLIEGWEDKVPNIAKSIRDVLPLKSVAQQGKLVELETA